MSSLGKGDEGSENGTFEDPLCNSVEIPLHPRGPGRVDKPAHPCGWLDAFARTGTAVCANARRPHGRLLASAQMRPFRVDGPLSLHRRGYLSTR
jgi:hypothetical protein